MKEIIFKGAGVALITPMNKDGSVDFNGISKLIEFQLNNKTDAIISCGTTGEPSTLSEEERIKVVERTIKSVGGRIPVIVGTGSNNTKHALSLSLKAQELGADALLIVTPYYNKTSQKGLVEHYIYIANRVKIPIILYNVPSRTGLNINPETCGILSKHKRIVAIKEASGNISQIAEIASICGSELPIYCGNDDQIIPTLSFGALGVISVFSNIFPKQLHDIVKRYFSGDHKKSLELFLSSLKLMNALFWDVNPIPVKAALNFIKLPSGNCRLPLTTLDSFTKNKLQKIIEFYIKHVVDVEQNHVCKNV
ncbi:MAG: 4-hydroxy-tetrahydrodipicolinate synthase [Oscillospiraceae bacterium]|jgi:4-hydroxy-tetrahydrodipicolinate synthase|nr:4-hydroxy-tetrahydrodipicolinate synthase [Oscillospiraceae bacterium]